MAIERTLAGERRWRSDVHVVAFLSEVMRSIADDYLNREQRHAQDREMNDDRDCLNPTRQQSNPEGLYYIKRVLETVDDLFADNEDAWLVINARAEGKERAEIKAELGLTDKQYEAASKQIQRLLPQLKEELGGRL